MRFGLAKYLDIIKINILTNEVGLLPSTENRPYYNCIRHILCSVFCF